MSEKNDHSSMYMWLRAKELPFTKGEFKHWCKTDFIFTLGFDQLGQTDLRPADPRTDCYGTRVVRKTSLGAKVMSLTVGPFGLLEDWVDEKSSFVFAEIQSLVKGKLH